MISARNVNNMNIAIIILIILATPFILFFILGAINASIVGSDKKRRARAMISLLKMTEEQRRILKDIFIAYRDNDVKKANKIAEQANSDTINFLVHFFDYKNRLIEHSSGNTGMIPWLNQVKKLRDLGYSEAISKILPIVILDNYNDVLEKMTKK